MANVLNTDKQIAVIGALAEGSSIRSIGRITGVHRDTIMRLGVRVGQGCQRVLDGKMRDLDCHYLQFDEIWGFIGKKEKHFPLMKTRKSVETFGRFALWMRRQSLVPPSRSGSVTANAFVQDVASRMRNRVQVSTDALGAYVHAVEQAFGADVDYGQIVKTYTHGEDYEHHTRRYSAPNFVSCEKKVIVGAPEMRLVSTSYIERLNTTKRLHMRRLTRLTLAFSKKRENFEAAVALHFAYYNFVKRHNTLRCTPAMAAGVERDFWSVGELGRGRRMSYIQELREAIHRMHGAEATHVESVPVKEIFHGETVWEGTVEVFNLVGNSKANRVYAWTHETDDPNKPKRHVAVLHIPPVVSPQTAVRAAIVQELRDAQA